MSSSAAPRSLWCATRTGTSTPSRTSAPTRTSPSPTGMSRAAPSNAGSTAASSTCAQAGRCSCRPCCPSPSTRCGWTRPPARSRSIRPGSSPPEHSTTPSSHPHRGEPHMSILEIKDLHATVETPEGTKEILKGVDLTIKGGEIHAIMGPNGSGKSTLAYAVAGHPKYEITEGELTLDGENVLEMSVDERARAGLFLAMQYPVEVPGVTVSNFLRTAKTAIDGEAPALRTWVKDMKGAMADLKMDPVFAERNVNEGFSGGEKKRHEILQMQLLKPSIAILDETDSGLDVDALRVVSEGVNRVKENSEVGIMLITHYTRILQYVKPDFVHVFVNGRIAEQGGTELAERLEAEGYDRYLVGA